MEACHHLTHPLLGGTHIYPPAVTLARPLLQPPGGSRWAPMAWKNRQKEANFDHPVRHFDHLLQCSRRDLVAAGNENVA
eukprot:253237-Rhodomonas_salina.2